jgi:hypothetical protein
MPYYLQAILLINLFNVIKYQFNYREPVLVKLLIQWLEYEIRKIFMNILYSAL